MMNIRYLNNDGGGFAAEVQVKHGTTIATFVEEQVGGKSPDAFLIRVNRETVTREYVLVDGDHVTLTPTNVQGA